VFPVQQVQRLGRFRHVAEQFVARNAGQPLLAALLEPVHEAAVGQLHHDHELVIDHVAADYWRSLYALTLALVLYFRVARPLVRAARLDLRVTEVVEEAPGVVSLRIGGLLIDLSWAFFSRT